MASSERSIDMKIRTAAFIVAGDHRLAVDQERLRLDAVRSINDGREAIDPIMTVAREAADPRAIPALHKPVAIVLHFVNPQRATFDGWHGSMKQEGRRTVMGGG